MSLSKIDTILFYKCLLYRGKFNDTKTKITDTIAHRKKVDAYLKNIKKQNELVAEFSEPMMATLMDYATVYSRQKVIFTFKDGTDIEVGLEE